MWKENHAMADVKEVVIKNDERVMNRQKEETAYHLSRVAKRIDLAKVEAGKMEVRRSDIDLGRLVAAQCDMIGSLSEDLSRESPSSAAAEARLAWEMIIFTTSGLPLRTSTIFPTQLTCAASRFSAVSKSFISKYSSRVLDP